VLIDTRGQEKSAFGFTITNDGKIVDIDTAEKPFVFESRASMFSGGF
jgi:hypothetical protein